MEKLASMNTQEILKKFKSKETGLSEQEAKKRLKKFGKNELIERKVSPFRQFISQFMEYPMVILLVASIISWFVGDILDATVILAVVFINAVVGFIQEYKAEAAMEKLKKLISPEAVVMRNGKKRYIPSSELVPGDIVIIREGDTVPADLCILDASNLTIDESSITGESVPVKKADNPKNAKNTKDLIVYMQSKVVSGWGKGVVIATGMNTEVGKIAEVIQEKEEKTPLQKRIAKLSKTLSAFALSVCVLVFILQTLKGLPIFKTFLTAVALAVAAVPEGLPAVLTLTLALGMQKMAKNNAIIRKLLAVETLGSCNVICTDKTGTLTKNEMRVRESYLLSENAFKVCTLCNNATINEKAIGDPTEIALLHFAKEKGYKKEDLEKKYPRIKEIPFDSSRKMMSTIHKKGSNYYVFTKGAPEVVLKKCKYFESNGKVQKLEEEDIKEFKYVIKKMANKALRVMALAYKKTTELNGFEEDLIFLGFVGMMDPPRKEVFEAIKLCKKAGIDIVMITGDHKDTAFAIAKELGILNDKDKILTGEELDRMSDKEFESIVEDIKVYARTLPRQKLRIVKALQKKGYIVAMTGDGVNDAPALKKASIGVAMGSGTDVAKDTADMVLQDDNFATIVFAIKEGRTIFANIRRFVKFQLSSNIGAILSILSSSIADLPTPFTPIQILWINIIMDGPLAQALGLEPPEKDIMAKKPVKRDILSSKYLTEILYSGVIMAIGTLLIYYFYLNKFPSKAVTVAFTTFVFFQLFNVFNCKSNEPGNKFLLIALLASILLQIIIVYNSFMQKIFGTTSLLPFDWLFIVLVSSTILINKLLRRKKYDISNEWNR